MARLYGLPTYGPNLTRHTNQRVHDGGSSGGADVFGGVAEATENKSGTAADTTVSDATAGGVKNATGTAPAQSHTTDATGTGAKGARDAAPTQTHATDVTASGTARETASGTAAITAASDATAAGTRASRSAAVDSNGHAVTAAGMRTQVAAGTALIDVTVLTPATGWKTTSGTAAETMASSVEVTGKALIIREGAAEPVTHSTDLTTSGRKAAFSDPDTAVAAAVTATGIVGVNLREGQALTVVNHAVTASGVAAETQPESKYRRRGLPWKKLPDEQPVERKTGVAHVDLYSSTAAAGTAQRAGGVLTASDTSTATAGRAARSGGVQTRTAQRAATRGRARHVERQRREDELLLLGAL